MADSASDSYFHSDTLSLRHLSSSLFSIHDFLVGFGSKGSSESDSVRSPTTPLDFGVFSNSSKSVGPRSARSLSQNGHQYNWVSSKVGLGIVNSLVDDTTSEVLDSSKRKNILFGPQVKANICNSLKHYNDSLDSSLKSKSLPKNYMVSLHYQNESLNTQLCSKNVVFGKEAEALQASPSAVTSSCSLDSTRTASRVSLTTNLNLGPENFCSEATTTISSSCGISTVSQVGNSLGIQSSTLPIPIDSSQGYVGSLSAREIELSEDYTCIISHGPNPKTIHIFGDCILECHTNELSNFGKKEDSGVTLPQVAKNLKGLTPDSSDEVLKFCYTCEKRLEEGEGIYKDRFVQTFIYSSCLSLSMLHSLMRQFY